MKNSILIFASILVFALTSVCAQAQTKYSEGGAKLKTGAGSTSRSSTLKAGSNTMQFKELAIPKDTPGSSARFNDKYNDTGLGNLEKRMSDRDWQSEDTAWERARKEDTREAYMKYMVRYPNGAHTAKAHSRIVEIDVENIMSNPHDDIPEWKCVKEDNDSPTSTILVENHTEYQLTVMFSGVSAKSLVIGPYGKGSVTIDNGYYKVAASVPDPKVRPFAGIQTVGGGSFECGFWIVRL